MGVSKASFGASPHHAAGTTACRLRVFRYESYLPHLHQQQRSGRHFGSVPDSDGNVTCLAGGPCQFDDFSFLNIIQYTSDVPIYQRLVSTCPSVNSAAEADIFLVPFYYGYMMTLGWHKQKDASWKAEHRGMMDAALQAPRLLPHLTSETAHRHVVLFSCDVQFLNLELHPQMRNAMILHLGDDDMATAGRATYPRQHVRNAITVPYRVSQWLPFGFNRSNFVYPRSILLSMNVNMARHPVRREVAAAINRSAVELAVPSERLLLQPQMQKPRRAAEVALASTFCLCPTGDSKGFTARFYFSLLHGCLPVRVDGWRRGLSPPAYPFPQMIDWDKLVVDVPPHEAPSLLGRLLAMPDAELSERQSHLRRVAHWLLYDLEEHTHHDAPAAVVRTIQARLFGDARGT